MKTNLRFGFLLLSTVLVLPLAACQTTTDQSARLDRENKIGAALERASDQASSQGHATESLALLESSYKRNSSDMTLAVKYAHALRMADRLNRASVVLAPFVSDDSKASAAAHIEYASIMAAMGTYDTAESHARQAVLIEPENAQAYHLLGIALDAQGHHQQAEVALRKGLDYWEGDPGPIMNNLGLNLATQGFIDEAIDTLRKAVAISPDRQEIERNLRIVSALQVQPPKSGFRLVPRPARKPDHTANAVTEEDGQNG